MSVDVSETLRQALSKLETEKGRIDRQIAAVREALKATGPGADAGSVVPTTKAKRGRKRMSVVSRPLLNLAERGGRASYPQFTATRGIPT